MKVTLLGDSIRQQYCGKVRELLGADFEVWAPEENCRFAKYTLRGLFDWAENMKGTDIVHWNNGLWDVSDLFGDGTFSNEDEYAETMIRIADILQKRCRAIIFATTTPVRTTNKYNSNEDIDRFNQRMVSLLRERGVIINDLNALLRSDVDKYICDDTIHLSEIGINVCAERIAACIKDAVEHLSNPSVDGVRLDAKPQERGVGAPILL